MSKLVFRNVDFFKKNRNIHIGFYFIVLIPNNIIVQMDSKKKFRRKVSSRFFWNMSNNSRFVPASSNQSMVTCANSTHAPAPRKTGWRLQPLRGPRVPCQIDGTNILSVHLAVAGGQC